MPCLSISEADSDEAGYIRGIAPGAKAGVITQLYRQFVGNPWSTADKEHLVTQVLCFGKLDQAVKFLIWMFFCVTI